ncbi:hypothetical protein C8J57DRAFT_1581543 [Mycena rebaudengoi]|nr:hypothetical protein C8J57DRAFT_1581543 [Mycena rebaudengoi]
MCSSEVHANVPDSSHHLPSSNSFLSPSCTSTLPQGGRKLPPSSRHSSPPSLIQDCQIYWTLLASDTEPRRFPKRRRRAPPRAEPTLAVIYAAPCHRCLRQTPCCGNARLVPCSHLCPRRAVSRDARASYACACTTHTLPPAVSGSAAADTDTVAGFYTYTRAQAVRASHALLCRLAHAFDIQRQQCHKQSLRAPRSRSTLEGLSYVAIPFFTRRRAIDLAICVMLPPRAISFRTRVFAGRSSSRGRTHLRLRKPPCSRSPARFGARVEPVDFPAAHGHGGCRSCLQLTSHSSSLPPFLFDFVISGANKFVSRILRPPNRRGGRSVLLRLVLAYTRTHHAAGSLSQTRLARPEDVRMARAAVQARLSASRCGAGFCERNGGARRTRDLAKSTLRLRFLPLSNPSRLRSQRRAPRMCASCVAALVVVGTFGSIAEVHARLLTAHVPRAPCLAVDFPRARIGSQFSPADSFFPRASLYVRALPRIVAIARVRVARVEYIVERRVECRVRLAETSAGYYEAAGERCHRTRARVVFTGMWAGKRCTPGRDNHSQVRVVEAPLSWAVGTRRVVGTAGVALSLVCAQQLVSARGDPVLSASPADIILCCRASEYEYRFLPGARDDEPGLQARDELGSDHMREMLRLLSCFHLSCSLVYRPFSSGLCWAVEVLVVSMDFNMHDMNFVDRIHRKFICAILRWYKLFLLVGVHSSLKYKPSLTFSIDKSLVL